MDLLEDMFNALEGKGYDDFTKIRWIYLYVCEMFSYDTRCIYARKSMKETIYNKKVDITNVEDFEVVCYTLSRILVDALTAFGYKCEIKSEVEVPLSHVYVIVMHDDFILKLDPTKRHDITRVKINSTTIDFEPVLNDDLFPDQLLDTDKKLASQFNGLYFGENSIANIAKIALEECDSYAIKHNLSKTEKFFKKLDLLFELIDSRTDLKRYDDIDFYYSYLLRIFKINKKEVIEKGVLTYQDCHYVKPVVLFNPNDSTTSDIINISCVQYESLPPRFYLLKKVGESFKVREIFKDEALDLLSKYENPLCQHMILELAKKLPTERESGIIFPTPKI